MIVQCLLAETFRVADATDTVAKFGSGTNAIPLAQLFVYLLRSKVGLLLAKLVEKGPLTKTP